VVKASRSSIHLAADPRVGGVNRTYFTTRSRPAPWPDAVLDRRNRDAVWALCERLAD
jgi:hypothetical protein